MKIADGDDLKEIDADFQQQRQGNGRDFDHSNQPEWHEQSHGRRNSKAEQSDRGSGRQSNTAERSHERNEYEVRYEQASKRVRERATF